MEGGSGGHHGHEEHGGAVTGTGVDEVTFTALDTGEGGGGVGGAGREVVMGEMRGLVFR